MVEWWALLAHPAWRCLEQRDGAHVLCDGAARGGCGAALLYHQAANPTSPHPSTVGHAMGCGLQLVPCHSSPSLSPCPWPPILIRVTLSLATHPHPTIPSPAATSHWTAGLPTQGSSSPAWRPNIAQFFKRGPISFTNEGPMVPGRICSGPAHWPGRIVLPPPPQEPIVPGPSRAAPGGLMGAGVPPAGAPAAQLAAAQGLGPADL